MFFVDLFAGFEKILFTGFSLFSLSLELCKYKSTIYFAILNPIETMLTTTLDSINVNKNDICQHLKHVNDAGDDFSSNYESYEVDVDV